MKTVSLHNRQATGPVISAKEPGYTQVKIFQILGETDSKLRVKKDHGLVVFFFSYY